jgi:hypothetical protein
MSLEKKKNKMPKYKLTPFGDEEDIEDGLWCCHCGGQIFYGAPYYIYEDEIYCGYCAGSNDIIDDAIEVDCTL